MPHLFRFCQLEEPAALRKQLLEESQRLQEFYRDVEGELSWIREKEPIASSDDLGKNLTGVQNLLKKHQVLLHYIVWYTILYCTVLYYTVPYYTKLYILIQ